MFKRNKYRKYGIEKLISINGESIGTGLLCNYLYKISCELNATLYFTYNKPHGLLRFNIYCNKDDYKAIQYFEDRCPALIETECRSNRDRYYGEFDTELIGIYNMYLSKIIKK